GVFFFSSRRRHTRSKRDWSSDVCSSDLDCGSLGDARAAAEAGVDIIGTTLAGYTGERAPVAGPDLELISAIRDAGLAPMLIAEGRIHTPDHAATARRDCSGAVDVGSPLTHSTRLSSSFAKPVDGH